MTSLKSVSLDQSSDVRLKPLTNINQLHAWFDPGLRVLTNLAVDLCSKSDVFVGIFAQTLEFTFLCTIRKSTSSSLGRPPEPCDSGTVLIFVLENLTNGELFPPEYQMRTIDMIVASYLNCSSTVLVLSLIAKVQI